MPSTYTSSLRLTLPATGELAGVWGATVNNGVTSLVDQAVAGSVTITMLPDTNYTLSIANGGSDESRNMFINVVGGPHTTTKNVICPALSKMYVVTNATSGGQSIVFKTALGSGVTIKNNLIAMVYCNGSSVSLITSWGIGNDLILTTNDTSVYATASTTGNAGFTAQIDGAAAYTKLNQYGNTAAGTVAGVSAASLGHLYFTGSAGLVHASGASAPLVFATAAGESMRITSTGRVGIGVASPSTILEVDGVITARAYSTGGGYMQFLNPSNTTTGMLTYLSAANVGNLVTTSNSSTLNVGVVGTGGTLNLKTNNTTQLQITSAGYAVFSNNVGIGDSNPPVLLSLNSNNFTTGMRMTNNGVLYLDFYASSGGVTLSSVQAKPIALATSSTARVKVTSAGSLEMVTKQKMGYGTGAGAAVTQATNKSTAVTINAPSGVITTSNALLAGGSSVDFVVNNSSVEATDCILLTIQTTATLPSTYVYEAHASSIASGTFVIRLVNGIPFNLSDAVPINFVVIKGSNA